MKLPAILSRNLPTVRSGTSLEDVAQGKPTVGNLIRSTSGKVRLMWNLAVERSDEYLAALDMRAKDLHDLKHHNGAVVVHCSFGDMYLIPKSTCGVSYGDRWRDMIQPRGIHRQFSGIGGGTSFFTVLPPAEHEEVIRAIQNGAVEVVVAHIWP